jgi:hypothetical protein
MGEMLTNNRIIDLGQAKAYFYRWECNSYQMSRDCDEYYSSYREIATFELENQWRQEYFEQIIADLVVLNNASKDVKYKYSEAVGILQYKKVTNKDILQLLDITKSIYNSNPNSTKIHIAGDIIKVIIPVVRTLDLLNEAREFMRIVEMYLLEDDEHKFVNDKLLQEYNQCENSLTDIVTIEQAKEYFIKYDCTRDKMKYDFKEIAASYFAIATDSFEKQWIQEAFERKITSIKNRDYVARDFPFYHTTVCLFESGSRSEKNSKLLLNASKSIKEWGNKYFYFMYAKAILEHVVPSLFDSISTNEARDFLKVAKDLISSTRRSKDDLQLGDTIRMYNEWMQRITI